MRIETLRIEGFGSLRGEVAFGPGPNLFLDDNEAGKSTLAAAIFALLYGSREESGKRLVKSEDELRYRPLAGGAFALGGTLRLDSGRRLEIWRDLAENVCTVVDPATGADVSAEFARAPIGDRLGEALTGLSRAQFEKVALFRQDEVSRATEFAEFADRLAAILSSAEAAGTVGAALEALQTARRKYAGLTHKGPCKIENEIKQLDQSVAETEAALTALEEERSGKEREFEAIAAGSARNEDLLRTVRRCDYLALRAREDELQSRRARQRQAGDKLTALKERIKKLAHLGGADLERGEELTALATRIEDLDARHRRLRRDEEELTRLAEAQELRARTLGAKTAFPPEKLKDLDVYLDRFQIDLKRRDAVRIDEDNALRALHREGIDREAALTLHGRIHPLSPQDRLFLGGYAEKADGLDARCQALLESIETVKGRIAGIDAERLAARRSNRNHALYGIVGAVSTVSACVFVSEFIHFFALPGALFLGFLGWAAWRYAGAQSLEADRRAELCARHQALEAELDALERQHRQQRQRLLALAQETGLEAEELLEDLRRFMSAQNVFMNWFHVHESLREKEESLAESEAELRELLGRHGIETEALTAESARRLVREVHEAARLQGECAGIATRREMRTRERTEAETALREAAAAARAILRAGGIDEELPLPEAVSAYREAERKKRTLLTLREERLPEAEEETDPAQMATELELTRVRERKLTLLAEFPELQAHEPERTVATYEQERQAAQGELARLQEDLQEKEKALAAENVRYRQERPRLLQRLAACRAARRKAERFDTATRLALETLETIAAEVHRRWSPLLSKQLGEMLARFNPAWSASLSKDLTLTVHAQSGGAPLTQENLARHLSLGMRDQLYLSLRVLLARHLGAGEALPLILDDPFVNADDARFAEGMRCARTLAQETQVFVFSCHKRRHETLLAQEPDFAEAVRALPRGATSPDPYEAKSAQKAE